MTVSTIYASNPTTQCFRYTDGSYANARSGVGTYYAFTDAVVVGQMFEGVYYCYQGVLLFNTSVIPDGDTISAATLSLGLMADYSTADFTVEVRPFDYGAAVGAADFINGDNLSGYALLASMASSGIGSVDQYKAFASEAAFLSNINKSGSTKLNLSSSRQRAASTPTGNEHMYWHVWNHATLKPKLVVTHAATASFLPGIMRTHFIPSLGG